MDIDDKLVDEAEDDLDRQDVAVPRSLSQPGVDLKPGSARSARSGMERVDVRLSERQQLHAFKGWFNAHLFKRGLKVESLAEGIASVVPLIHLLEILSDDKIPGIVKQHKKPRHKFDRMAALHLCLDFVNSRSRRRVDLSYDKSRLLSAKDVKLSLALAWRIILTFQQADTVESVPRPGGGGGTPFGSASARGKPVTAKTKTAAVVSWVNSTIQEAVADSGSDTSTVKIHNLTTDFLDGSVLVELLNLAVTDDDDRIIKEEFVEMVRTDMAHLEPRAGLLTALLQHGEEFCDLPQMIIVEDFLKNPDERSMLAYLSILKERIGEVREEKRIAAKRALMSPTGARRTALFETVQVVKEDILSPMDAIRLKEDVEFLKSKAATSVMELEMTKGTLAKVRDTMEEDRAGFAAERIALQREADELRSKATESAAECDSVKAEMERLRQELKDTEAKMSSLTPAGDFAPEVAAERETWFTQKISKMEAFMEEQKQKFSEAYNEQKEKLTRSNQAGRDYREKFRAATDDCMRATDALTEAHSELAVKEAAFETLEERVDSLKSELSSKTLMSTMQIKELGQFIKELKRKAKMRQRMDVKYMAEREAYEIELRDYYVSLGARLPKHADDRRPEMPWYPTEKGITEALETKERRRARSHLSDHRPEPAQSRDSELRRRAKTHAKTKAAERKEQEDIDALDFDIPPATMFGHIPAAYSGAGIHTADASGSGSSLERVAPAVARKVEAVATAATGLVVLDEEVDAIGAVPNLPKGAVVSDASHDAVDPYADVGEDAEVDLESALMEGALVDAAKAADKPKLADQESDDAAYAAKLQAEFESADRAEAERAEKAALIAAKALSKKGVISSAKPTPAPRETQHLLATSGEMVKMVDKVIGEAVGGEGTEAAAAAVVADSGSVDKVAFEAQKAAARVAEAAELEAEEDFDDSEDDFEDSDESADKADVVDSGKFWMTEAAKKLVKAAGVNPFHQMYDSKKTRMGSDKTKVVWNFLGTDGNIHVVGLKHSYSSSAVQKGSKTKKTLVVDGRQTLSKKTADRQLHFAVGKDALILGIVPDQVRSAYRYILLINGQRHDDMSLEYYSKRRM